MTPDDRPHFAAAMTRLFAIYGDELTDALLEAWWGVLKAYELREVRLAMNSHATDPDKGRWRPTPADMIRHITDTLPALRGKAYAARIRAARERIAPLEERLLRLEKDVELGLIEAGAATPEVNGLRMQIGALVREAGINDRPRLTGPAAAPKLLGDSLDGLVDP